ncbi:MAG: hypothetical protein H7320_01555 [Ferruginibacter sp.]|nr:hypothetical protein [Ferruginibacter sp.]
MKQSKSLTGLLVYPNPISNSTNISFSLPQSQKVSIPIFDGAVRLVKNIVEAQNAG